MNYCCSNKTLGNNWLRWRCVFCVYGYLYNFNFFYACEAHSVIPWGDLWRHLVTCPAFYFTDLTDWRMRDHINTNAPKLIQFLIFFCLLLTPRGSTKSARAMKVFIFLCFLSFVGLIHLAVSDLKSYFVSDNTLHYWRVGRCYKCEWGSPLLACRAQVRRWLSVVLSEFPSKSQFQREQFRRGNKLILRIYVRSILSGHEVSCLKNACWYFKINGHD